MIEAGNVHYVQVCTVLGATLTSVSFLKVLKGHVMGQFRVGQTPMEPMDHDDAGPSTNGSYTGLLPDPGLTIYKNMFKFNEVPANINSHGVTSRAEARGDDRTDLAPPAKVESFPS